MARIYKRGKHYVLDFNDLEGRRHRRVVKTNEKRIAEEALYSVLNKIAKAEWDCGAAESPKIGFSDFAKKIWWPRVRPTLGATTAERWSGIVRNHLRPFFGCSLRAIELGMIEKFVAARLEAGANPATANREVHVLRHILRRAMVWKDDAGVAYLKNYPLQNWKPQQESSGQTRFLDQDEISALLIACRKSRCRNLEPFVRLALNTGLRRGEILALTRKDVDWNSHTATITHSKNGEVGHVPLNSEAMAALRALPIRLDGKFFDYAEPDTISAAFRLAAAHTGIEGASVHTLRHTFASWHAMSGAQQRSLQGLLRHKSAKMTARYAHLSDAHLRAAVDAVNLGAVAAKDKAAS